MSELSEEEIINKVDKFIDVVTVILPDYSTKIPEYCIDEETWIAIKGLLDLYQKEKEKNKELENADLTTVYMNGFYNGEKKWKNKIKVMLEGITKEHSSILSNDKYSLNDKNIATFQYNAMRKILEELLKERN